MKINVFSSVVLAATVLLSACGGGSESKSGELTQVQKNFEASTLRSGYKYFNWSLPSTNVAPTDGTHYFEESNFSVSQSPSSGAAKLEYTATNLATTLKPADATKLAVYRILKNGKIYFRNVTSPTLITYAEGVVKYSSYDDSGSVKLWTMIYDEWSEARPLSGLINVSGPLKSYVSFMNLYTPTNFDFSKNWLAGSTYVVRKNKYEGDIIQINDWMEKTYGDQPTPSAGSAKTIEEFFNSSIIAANGGVEYDGIVYSYLGGTIRQAEGARIWVANNKRPTSASPTDTLYCLIELGGKLYTGHLIKAGTRVRVLDALDKTIVRDDSVRLNDQAIESIRQMIRF